MNILRHLFSALISKLRPLKNKTDKSFFKSVAILAGGAAGGQLVGLLVTPFLTRIYNPSEFGVLAMYTAVVAIFMAIGSLRFDQAIGLPKSEKTALDILIIALWCGALSAAIAAIIIAIIPSILLGESDLDISTAWLSVLVFLGVLLSLAYQAINVWALRRKEFVPVAKTKVTQGVGVALSQIIFGVFGFGAFGLLAGQIMGQSLGSTNLARLTLRHPGWKHPRLQDLKKVFRRYRRFPLLATPAALLNSLSLQVIVIVLTSMVSPAAAGQYMLSSRITVGPLGLIGNSIGNVFYAEATAIGRTDANKLRKLLIDTSKKSFIIGLIPSALFFFFSPEFFKIIFGDAWGDAGLYSQALSIMLLASFAANPISQIFIILEQQFVSLFLNIIKFITVISGAGIPILLGFDSLQLIWSYSICLTIYYCFVLLIANISLSRLARNE